MKDRQYDSCAVGISRGDGTVTQLQYNGVSCDQFPIGSLLEKRRFTGTVMINARAVVIASVPEELAGCLLILIGLSLIVWSIRRLTARATE